MNFHPFVLPFTLGMTFLPVILATRYFRWLSKIEQPERHRFFRTLFSWKLLTILREIFLDGLLHHKIFRKNFCLGYLHASIAFGWFLLILAGAVENKIYSHSPVDTLWDSVFFKYFHHDLQGLPFVAGFQFIMDFLLLTVLSGVLLAWLKRVHVRIVGLRKTTRHLLIDRIGLAAIWSIFPLRLIAESITAGRYHNGGFLTQSFGDLLASLLPLQDIEDPAWWAYSISLGTFLLLLPFTRYMHIPTEVMLIALRNSGLKTSRQYTGYTEFEVYSCSRCGICIESCQIRHVVNRTNMVPAYYLQGVRQMREDLSGAFDCLMCGRCQEACPVGIDITAIRQVRRRQMLGFSGCTFAYLDPPAPPRTEMIYFAGCMTHLTPSIKQAMTHLLEKARADCWFMDRDGAICCGRPLQLAGKDHDASLLKEHNRKLILESGASVLVASCPICLRTFKHDYELGITVLHHTELLEQWVRSGRLHPGQLPGTAVYHDPCELGRGLNGYDSPRAVLDGIVSLQVPKQERRQALCCGGSIADLALHPEERAKIAAAAASELCEGHPDHLITSCPLCKKTFDAVSPARVKDIAEVVVEACQHSEP